MYVRLTEVRSAEFPAPSRLLNKGECRLKNYPPNEK
jgi:hypothetical protein